MRKARFTTRGRSFLSAGLTLVIGGALLGFPDISRLGGLLIVLVGATWWMALRRDRTVEVHRSLRPSIVTAGSRCVIDMEFRNSDRRRSRYGLAQESLAYALGEPPRFVLPGIAPGESRVVSYTVAPRIRGEHRIGPVEISVRDPFGLTRRHITVDALDQLLVLPRIVPLGASHPPGAGSGHEGTTPAMIALHGEEDVSLRTYQDGDDLRKVHWPATAHRGELMVRQLDRPARRSCVLVLDSRGSAHAGHGEHSSFEWAVSALASIAVRMYELGYLVHLVSAETVAGGHHLVDLPPDATQLWFARARLGEDSDFDAVLQGAHDVAGTGAVVVAAVADDLSGFEESLGSLRQPGASALGLVLNTATFGGATVPVPAPLADFGWRVEQVDADTTIERAWSSITRRSLIRVGAL
ncbi:DUF58 domain-containing protein [Calidifontibacter indicus]|uniref:DUF58 domain-containing protein n=1 Tax=Calidifontibacter indicus TaxID=419650 RepID=UPI003D743A01